MDLRPEQFTAMALRRARERSGLSSRAACAAAGLSASAVLKVESGAHVISLRTFGQLARVLKLSPEEVWLIVCNEGRTVD